ncbi:DMT family transporter [Kiloniella sp. b19]|uniref:DMT family transporter n=1 Tax=Kiloniella sp. GXU_MW_B19 TaxID=3141326 RepID=UPI0031D490B1
MNVYVMLALAILCELVGTMALKYADGFTRFWPSVIVVLGYGCAFYLLSLLVRHLPIGLVYAVWSGVGITLVALAGVVLFDQKLDWPGIAGMGMIIGGVVILNGFSNMGSH